MTIHSDRATNVETVRFSEQIEQMMKNSINYLIEHLSCEWRTSETHEVIVINGLDVNETAINYVAQYLVGLRACAIDAALNIRAALFDEDFEENRIDLYRSICEIVGTENQIMSDDQKQDERNPWIAEGLWNLCMVIANDRPEFHPPGRIVGLNYVHVNAKDHGFDGLAIYDNGSYLGLSVIESKAYKNDPNKAINKALNFFKEIDEEKHSTRLRQEVHSIRTAMPINLQEKISNLFWKKRRTYIPNPHYDSSNAMNWTNRRPSFEELKVPKENIIIMPNIISDFDGFFDKISDNMRECARGFMSV